MEERSAIKLIEMKNEPCITGYAAYVGKKEKEGPLGGCFCDFDMDTAFAQESWEKAESELQKRAFSLALRRAAVSEKDVELLFGGDLLNQCIASAYAARESGIPYIGLYGACSTMALSLALASGAVNADMVSRAVAITSSHFCAAERQYRFPLEYGGQRAPASQWTVTGSGCCVVEKKRPDAVRVLRAAFGSIIDYEICDINNMGVAMAPAAASTVCGFLRATKTRAVDYGAIVTGDLGAVGSQVFLELCEHEGFDIPNHLDCGKMIYDRERQDVKAGGSGCGCCASVLGGYFLPNLERGEMRDIVFTATGALMSPTSFQQKESIPSIAHLVHLKSPRA